MPTWNDLRVELDQRSPQLGVGALDVIRRERMKKLADHTGRPVIIYVVDFLNQAEKARAAGRSLNIDLADKEGFVEVSTSLPAGPLDLLLHSPGGNPVATESIVQLLRSRFNPIRVFVPNVAKSAATMLALSANEIAMDERGELGPIDPQMVLTSDQQVIVSPAQALLDQFKRAQDEVQRDSSKLASWLPMLRQYGPSLLKEAENAIALSKDLVKQWLLTYMYAGDPGAVAKADRVTTFFGEHNNFLSHGRMVGIDKVIELGVNVVDLRRDAALQALVWELYSAISLTFDRTGAYKIIENHIGHAFIQMVQQVQIVGNLPQMPTPQPAASPPAPQLNREQRRRMEQEQRRKNR